MQIQLPGLSINLIIVIAVLVATAVPLIALYFIKRLDLYGTGSFQTVMACFVWGIVSVGLAYLINTTMLNAGVAHEIFQRFTAPPIEELLKAIILLILVRRANFTYFVDGAVYGFASGIGFAIAENYYYVANNTDAALGLAVARVLSTNLMHASSCAIVGIALGLARFQKMPGRLWLVLAGFVAAITLHVGFNNLVTTTGLGIVLMLVYAIGAGLSGAAAIALTMRRGLADQKRWIEEELRHIEGVTSMEADVVDRITEADKLLAPIKATLGEDKAEKIERLLFLQARLGIQQKTLEKLPDERMKRGVEAQIQEMREEVEKLQQGIGASAMLYLRTIIPRESISAFDRLGDKFKVLEERRRLSPTATGPNPFKLVGEKMSTMSVPKAGPDSPGGGQGSPQAGS